MRISYVSTFLPLILSFLWLAEYIGWSHIIEPFLSHTVKIYVKIMCLLVDHIMSLLLCLIHFLFLDTEFLEFVWSIFKVTTVTTNYFHLDVCSITFDVFILDNIYLWYPFQHYMTVIQVSDSAYNNLVLVNMQVRTSEMI